MMNQLAPAEEISVDATVAAVVLDLDDIFTFTMEQGKALRALLAGQHVFALVSTGFIQGLVKHH